MTRESYCKVQKENIHFGPHLVAIKYRFLRTACGTGKTIWFSCVRKPYAICFEF